MSSSRSRCVPSHLHRACLGLQLTRTCLVVSGQVRLTQDEFLHASAVADTFSQVLQAGQMTGWKRKGLQGRSSSRQRQAADQRRRLDEKKAAFARAAMAERIEARHTLHSGARPASSGSDRKHPARTTLELVLKCSSIAVSLITDISAQADAREYEPQESKKEAPGSRGASECGQHVLKLMLSGLDLAAQRTQVCSCLSLSIACVKCVHLWAARNIGRRRLR